MIDGRLVPVVLDVSHTTSGWSLRLRFDVFNIFDRKADDITYYYRSRLPGEPANGVNDIHSHPVERRSLRLAMLFKF